MPQNLLPICRWWLGDILEVAARFSRGESAYSIAKGLCESLASLLHLKAWMVRASAYLEALAREMGFMDAMPPRPAPMGWVEAFSLTGLRPAWPAFTHAFSRTFYPKRFPLWSTHTILTG